MYAASTGTSTPIIAIGTYLSKAKAIVTAAQEALPKEILVEFPDGSYTAASLAHEGSAIAIYGFADSAILPKISSPTLIPDSELKLGQTVIAISADGSAATGIVARVSTKGVYTTLPDIGAGSAAVDLSGNLVGLGAGVTPGLLISTNKITALLNATSTTATSTSTSK